jgi:hypothetical protein
VCLVVAAVFKTVEGQFVLGGSDSFPLRQSIENQGVTGSQTSCYPLLLFDESGTRGHQNTPKRSFFGQQMGNGLSGGCADWGPWLDQASKLSGKPCFLHPSPQTGRNRIGDVADCCANVRFCNNGKTLPIEGFWRAKPTENHFSFAIGLRTIVIGARLVYLLKTKGNCSVARTTLCLLQHGTVPLNQLCVPLLPKPRCAKNPNFRMRVQRRKGTQCIIAIFGCGSEEAKCAEF